MKKTPWFEIQVKPFRRGVYETELVSRYGEVLLTGFSRWNGREWMDTEQTVEKADKACMPGVPSKRWRGLSEPPK